MKDNSPSLKGWQSVRTDGVVNETDKKKHPVCFASTPLKEGNFNIENGFTFVCINISIK